VLTLACAQPGGAALTEGVATVVTLAGSVAFEGFLLRSAGATLAAPSTGGAQCGGIGHTDKSSKSSVTFELTPPVGATSVTVTGFVLVSISGWYAVQTVLAVAPAPAAAPAAALPPTPPLPPPTPPPRPPLPPGPELYDGGASYCISGSAFCVAWSADLAASTATFFVRAPGAAYVALGFGEEYGTMAPADVWVVWSDAGGAGVLSHRHNDNGYAPPVVMPLPAGSGVAYAAQVDGVLEAVFHVPLPHSMTTAEAQAAARAVGRRRRLTSAPGGAVNFIWSVGSQAPAREGGWLRQHGSDSASRGIAIIDLLCEVGTPSTCVLESGQLPRFTRLHAIALAGFLVTVGAGAVAHAARRRLFALECVAQYSLARTPLAPLAAKLGASSQGLPELLLLLGYALTLGIYLAAALKAHPASAARAVGSLLPPTFGVALLPITRMSVFTPLLGVSFERAIAYHRFASGVAMCIMAAHIAMMVCERGVDIMTTRTENSRGQGAVFGTASAATFAALVALAAPPVRRYSWEAFKTAHMMLFPTALVLAVLHAKLMLPYLAPAVLLWVADMALRALRAARSHPLSALVALPGGAVRLDVTTAGRVAVAPGQYAFVQLPELGPAEWHPFSCVCVPGRPEGIGFVIGRGKPGSFAARLAALAALTPKPVLRVRVDGAYGGPRLQLHSYTAVVLLAGGVGITPFASICNDLVAAAHAGDSALSAATLVWAVRDAAAINTWIPGLLPATSGLFTVRVFVTGAPPGDDAERGGGVTYGRPDVDQAVRDAALAAHDAGAPPRRVAVMACGPPSLIAAAQAAAAAQGCHFHAELFSLN
jgi:ferredoxin-NADP reductase